MDGFNLKLKKESFRDYQWDVLMQIEKHWRNKNTKHIYVCMPTGSGKSSVIAAAPVFLKIQRRALNLVPWIVLNQSNASLYSEEKWQRHFTDDCEDQILDDIKIYDKACLDSTSSDYKMRKNALSSTRSDPIVYCTTKSFQSTLANSKTSARELKVIRSMLEIIQVDEIHDVSKPCLETIDGFECTKIFFSALHRDIPPDAAVVHVPYTVLAGKYVKEPYVLQVPTMIPNPDEETQSIIFNGQYVADMIKATQVTLGKIDATHKPGAIVKCPTIQHAKLTMEVITQRFPEMKAGIVHSKQSPNVNNQVKDLYGAGKIDVIVLVEMLSIGWHEPRTCVATVMSPHSFSTLLQFFGRCGSMNLSSHPTLTKAYLVMADWVYNKTQFCTLFCEYATLTPHEFIRVHQEILEKSRQLEEQEVKEDQDEFENKKPFEFKPLLESVVVRDVQVHETNILKQSNEHIPNLKYCCRFMFDLYRGKHSLNGSNYLSTQELPTYLWKLFIEYFADKPFDTVHIPDHLLHQFAPAYSYDPNALIQNSWRHETAKGNHLRKVGRNQFELIWKDQFDGKLDMSTDKFEFVKQLNALCPDWYLQDDQCVICFEPAENCHFLKKTSKYFV